MRHTNLQTVKIRITDITRKVPLIAKAKYLSKEGFSYLMIIEITVTATGTIAYK